jgi:hypothetical protein
MNGLVGFPEPTREEFIAGKLDASKSDKLLDQPSSGYEDQGTLRNDKTYKYTWNVDGLAAQTPYQIHLYVEDLGYNPPEKQPSQVYTTQNRFNRATFLLKFL